jgi:hypothetical protein
LVTATNVETNQSRESTADGEGRYRFPYLPVGTYRLRAERLGFAALTRQLTLTLGQALDVSLVLSVAGVAESVEVSGADAALIETARTQVAETIAPKEIDTLPLNGRNYLDLARSRPASRAPTPVRQPALPETSAVAGTGLSITGQRIHQQRFRR